MGQLWSYNLVRGDHFRFGYVFIKKSNQTETSSNRPVSVWFDFLGQKLVWLGFGSFFSGLTWFFSVFSVWVRFGSVFSVLGL
jgi:hypothetical protein